MNIREMPETKDISPIGGEGGFSTLMGDIAETSHVSGGEARPFVEESGGEIHPDLEGISFKYWTTGAKGDNRVGVNYTGIAEKAPWANQLTGKVFEDFTKAKGWLRHEAERLSKR